MSEVKRIEIDHKGLPFSDENGVYVFYEDYAKLEVQLANAESKCRELAAEISRRDEIFIPVYPDNNLMNQMTDVFHDAVKIHCDEDDIFVDNAELVITSIINNYIKSDDAFLAEVRAQGVDMFGQHHNFSEKLFIQKEAQKFAAQLRKGAANLMLQKCADAISADGIGVKGE